MAVNRDHIHELINRLSDNDLALVSDLMERLTQFPAYRDIPLDDEPTTQEDLDAIHAADEALEKGELISYKDIKHELRN
ncbi:MAG: hypothetical protein K0R57_1861 [Paenibacillaceae bacterium]|nr:hypothetical protein [Paenibacillaceae bacterium]